MASVQIKITVNGEPRRVAPRMHLDQLAEYETSGSHEGIAVAVNGEVVPRRLWQEREVRDGDDIEIVHAVQGG